MTGIPGVAMATSGPGATNLITAIGSCYFDSVPVVFITGQVNRNELRGGRPVRQAGFQETDIVSMVRGITKDARLLDDSDGVAAALADAFLTARSGRPGPVLLDIPMDVQWADVAGPVPTRPRMVVKPPSPRDVTRVVRVPADATRPVGWSAGEHGSPVPVVRSGKLPICWASLWPTRCWARTSCLRLTRCGSVS